MRALLKPDLGDVHFSVSRVDLFADWQGWALALDDAHRFVCRADTRRTYEVGGLPNSKPVSGTRRGGAHR
jgi:hypothetical protein